VTEQPSAPAAPPQPAVDFDALEDEIDQLQTRAAAVNRSLDVLQQEQARLGLGLRGDIAARQESMNLNLTRARESIGQRNVTRVQRFKTAVESDVEALERFLGR
jgi:eukaryotic-like serine/threonine-protein kinase